MKAPLNPNRTTSDVSWLQRLNETYETCAGVEQFSASPLPPISHTYQQAHIEIVLDKFGAFRRASILQKEYSLIPVTEASAGRTSNEAAHPLCDKLQYVAGDYANFGGRKSSFYRGYIELLESWCTSCFMHPKAQAVLHYVRQGHVVADLVKSSLLHVADDGKLLRAWPVGRGPKPDIFRLIPAGGFDQGSALVRWQVEIPHDPSLTTGFRRRGETGVVPGDATLQASWIAFHDTMLNKKGFCMATGRPDIAIASSHPRGLRRGGDGAKLISSNDEAGFTFRGRFTDRPVGQGCTIGYEASQKAHLALRWLIDRQAYSHGDQVVVSWSLGGHEIPDPMANSFVLFG